MVAPNPVENALFVPRLVLNNGVVVLCGKGKKKEEVWHAGFFTYELKGCKASGRSDGRIEFRHSPWHPFPSRKLVYCSAAMEYASFLRAHYTTTMLCGLASGREGEGPSIGALSAGCDLPQPSWLA